MEDDLKILKVEYLITTIWIVPYEFLGEIRGNLECGSAQPSLFYSFKCQDM